MLLSNDHDKDDDVCNDEKKTMFSVIMTIMFEIMIMITQTIMFVRICNNYDDHVNDNADNHVI